MRNRWKSGSLVACMLALAACADADDPPEDTFAIVADRIPGGVLLSAGSDGDEVLFVGGELGGGPGVIVRYTGDALCVERDVAARVLWWIHVPRPGEWYAVGEAGTIVHEVDGIRTDESVPTMSTLYGVWDDGERVIAVGGDVFGTRLGEVWVRRGGSWEQLAADLPGVAFKVWRNWVVGDGVAYVIEGDTLVPRPAPDGPKLLTVVGWDEEEVWAVGGVSRPEMVHYAGGSWEVIDVSPFCGSQPLNGVWTARGEDVWIAGSFGTTGRRDGREWHCPEEPPTFEHFHAVWRHGDELLWAGGNLFSMGDNYGTIARFGQSEVVLTPTDCE